MAGFKYTLLGAALGLVGATGVAAAAVPGYTLPEANLRAGPGRDYPFISQVPPGRPAEIFGCVGGWGWCDVDVDGARGWISGRKLQVLDDGRRMGLSYYGPRFGLPVIQFDIGTYWGQYYQGRPFFAEHQRWDHGNWNMGGGYGHPPGIHGAPPILGWHGPDHGPGGSPRPGPAPEPGNGHMSPGGLGHPGDNGPPILRHPDLNNQPRQPDQHGQPPQPVQPGPPIGHDHPGGQDQHPHGPSGTATPPDRGHADHAPGGDKNKDTTPPGH